MELQAVRSYAFTTSTVYRFDQFELDLHLRELRAAACTLRLSNKAMDVLVHLVEKRGRLVSRDELLRAVWPRVHVAPGSLTQAVWEIRKALCDPLRESRIIKTSRTRGYRFAAEVRFDADEFASSTQVPVELRQRLDGLPWDTRRVVLELASALATHATRA